MTRRASSVRVAVLAAAVAVATAATALPALAVGTAGVELRLVASRDPDGTPVVDLAAGRSDAAQLELENLVDEPRRARVYTASADVAGGSVEVGAAGSVPWLAVDEEVTLGPGERRRLPLVGGVPAPPGVEHVAVVLEVRRSASLVTQAVTVARVEHGVDGRRATLAVVAAALVTGAVTALARFGPRRAVAPA